MATKPTADQKRAKRKKLASKAAATRKHEQNRYEKAVGFERMMVGGFLNVEAFAANLNVNSKRPRQNLTIAGFRTTPEFEEIKLRITELVAHHRRAYDSGDNDVPLMGRIYTTFWTEQGKAHDCFALPYESLRPRGVDLKEALIRDIELQSQMDPVVFFTGIRRLQAIYNVAIIMEPTGDCESYLVSDKQWYLVNNTEMLFLIMEGDTHCSRALDQSAVPIGMAVDFAVDEMLGAESKDSARELSEDAAKFMLMASTPWANEVNYLGKAFSVSRAELADKIYLDVWAEFQERIVQAERTAAELGSKNSLLQTALEKASVPNMPIHRPDSAIREVAPAKSIEQRFAAFF